MEKLFLNWYDIEALAAPIAHELSLYSYNNINPLKVYGVPNGGVYAAQAVQTAFYRSYRTAAGLTLVHDPADADVYIDDIIDTGRTRELICNTHGEKPFHALVNKQNDLGDKWKDKWIDFPWEKMNNTCGVRENIVRILEYIGENPKREGLLETPDRVIRSYEELFSGYKQDPKDIMKTFEDGVCDEMVLLKDVEFTSHCEHHMLFFTGKAHIAYIPNKRIIGVSKLARLLEIYSRRLQVQERLTTQITKALDEYLQPQGSACVVEAKHFCMVCRGVGKQNSVMVTSSLTGEFRKPEVRAEFFNLIRN